MDPISQAIQIINNKKRSVDRNEEERFQEALRMFAEDEIVLNVELLKDIIIIPIPKNEDKRIKPIYFNSHLNDINDYLTDSYLKEVDRYIDEDEF
jgi:hypothetical protein